MSQWISRFISAQDESIRGGVLTVSRLDRGKMTTKFDDFGIGYSWLAMVCAISVRYDKKVTVTLSRGTGAGGTIALLIVLLRAHATGKTPKNDRNRCSFLWLYSYTYIHGLQKG